MTFTVFELVLLIGGTMGGTAILLGWVATLVSPTPPTGNADQAAQAAQGAQAAQATLPVDVDGDTASERPSRPRGAGRRNQPRSSGITIVRPPSPSMRSVDISGVVDPLTGAQPDPSGRIFQCTRCQCVYGASSMAAIREVRAGFCVCGNSGDIREVSVARPQLPVAPSVRVNLSDYRNHVGQTVVFEGTVWDVKRRSGCTDVALLFEDGEWNDALKLVIKRGSVRAFGGLKGLSRLVDSRVRASGPLELDPMDGYHIDLRGESTFQVIF